MFKLADFVKETSTTTGTGTYSLAGAASGFRTFVAGVGDGNVCYYCAEDGTDWEIGIGTVTDATPDTLSRDTIISSSNSDAAVNWAAGTRNLFVTRAATPLRQYRYQSGELYHPWTLNNTTVTITQNYIYIYSMFVGEPVTIDGIAVYSNNSTATRYVRAGLYKDNGKGYPGALVVDSGDIDISTTGLKTATVSDTILVPGLYWLACAAAGAYNPSMYIGNTYSMENAMPMTADLSNLVGGYYNTGAAVTSLPDPFPGTTWTASLTNVQTLARVMIRVA